MATTTIAYGNGLVTPIGGINPLTGQGEDYHFTLNFTGNPAQVTLYLTDVLTGLQTQVGFGFVTGQDVTYVLTFNNKVYALAGGTVFASAIGDPTTWNNTNAIGNGFVQLSNWYSSVETLLAVAPYQGRLVFFSRRTAQIFIIDPNLANWQSQQILTNIGTVAPLSVQALGDLDVMFLSDTGIRSLRVRDMSLNAYVADIGSPIDSLIQTALLANNYTAACGVVEPQANRYWCYLNGVIYVLSYFPSVKVSAWGTYLPTYANTLTNNGAVTTYPAAPLNFVVWPVMAGRTYYWSKGANGINLINGTLNLTSSQSFVAQAGPCIQYGTAGQAVDATLEEQTPFTPQKFLVYNGQVYTRDASNAYLYGGANNNTYDGCIAVGETPWLDGKEPVLLKQVRGIDSAFKGAWTFFVGTNQLSETIQQVWQGNRPTFQLGQIETSQQGYHVKVRTQTWDNQPAVMSSIIARYQKGAEK